MFKLSYSTNGITNIDFFDAVKEIEKAGFLGVEISFQKNQFNPFTLTDDELNSIKSFFNSRKITPVAISTGTTFLLSEKFQHDPSIIDPNPLERQKRIDLIRRGIEIAHKLNIPIVSFQTGHLREVHINNPDINPKQILIEGIRKCLEGIGNTTLVIEPEPGMFVETLKDAMDLIEEVDSPSFGLHVDIGHAFCTEKNYAQAMGNAVPHIKYMHLADIKDGYNLEVFQFNSLSELDSKIIHKNLEATGSIVYLKEEDTFLFIEIHNTICFYNKPLNDIQKRKIEGIVETTNNKINACYIDYKSIAPLSINQDYEREVQSYIDSIPGVNLETLEKFKPVLRYLRTNMNNEGDLYISKPMCHTVRGKVHYHEFPGKGEIDFKEVFRELKKHKYEGFITVELYNHVDSWPETIPGSYKYLMNCI